MAWPGLSRPCVPLLPATPWIEPRSPYPPDSLAYDITNCEQRGCPCKSRGEICKLKMPEWHFEYTRNQRHDSTKRSKKSADENSWDAPPFHEDFSARNEIGVTRERPHMRNSIFELEPNPI